MKLLRNNIEYCEYSTYFVSHQWETQAKPGIVVSCTGRPNNIIFQSCYGEFSRLLAYNNNTMVNTWKLQI